MQFFFYILTIIFILLNIKIIVSDIKNKKIPNKYLIYLLFLIPFYYIYLNFPEINYFFFLLQIFITFIISFILYYFGIWAAGDAKYLLVLTLFIPYLGIISFIGNIALITLIYLFGYFLWFYFYKILFNKNNRQNLWKNIKIDSQEKWKIYKLNKGGNTIQIILKWLIIFLLIFISIRLIRLYLFNFILNIGYTGNFELIKEIIKKYNIYIVFLFIGLFILGLFIFKIFINKLKTFIVKKFKLNLNLIGNILLGILSIFLISFLTYEYFKNSYEIKSYLFKIFTLYLTLFLIFKILKIAYKITFGITEYQYIDIKNLKEGDIIDKNYFFKTIGNYITLSFILNSKRLKNIKNKYKKKSIFNKKEFIENILEGKLNNYKISRIKQIINVKNKIHKNSKDNKDVKHIRIINTFAFSPYIFLGFIITFLIGNQPINIILNYMLNYMKN